ncbi:pyridoxamine 5'-phosphate oxidase family protein [Undibacterium sp.]|jgi:PPOX class probable FMN-dependent enzyme|uniref:pyridoxamine 5'-phosphate oxidase family protein n=1 Tax=Undibacterium sp. TaxID=1914977 RepID=UPI002C6345D0|nr:pyridoxamine 5'-phosphate oxidase family protein [Undibacterium sp.]HTD04392.1 pyridoxamine 5'-phosphate oxidase family protein [Undibacterium sp.]
MQTSDSDRISSLAELEALYGTVGTASIRKEVDYLHPHYRALIAASTFAVLSTSGPGGLDASPRGDPAGFIQIADDNTLLLADRRGNNRIDSLRNILGDPRVALLFLIPGLGETLRVNGRAHISVAPELLQRFAVNEKAPRSVLVIHVETVFFQCSRAILRADLWNAARHVDKSSLPSAGAILATLTQAEIDGRQYDEELPQRLKTTLY